MVILSICRQYDIIFKNFNRNLYECDNLISPSLRIPRTLTGVPYTFSSQIICSKLHKPFETRVGFGMGFWVFRLLTVGIFGKSRDFFVTLGIFIPWILIPGIQFFSRLAILIPGIRDFFSLGICIPGIRDFVSSRFLSPGFLSPELRFFSWDGISRQKATTGSQ